ncbi:MAG: rhodanese-like domain-containing protein [Pseudomonadota bacterium]
MSSVPSPNLPVTTPAEVFDAFEKNADEIYYIDVRTVAEFVSGHPRGRVINVPIEFHHPHNDDRFANESFVLVIEDNCPKDANIVIGDEAGERAEKAAKTLIEHGYSNISVMLGGLKQWQLSALPVTGDNREGVSYVSLLTPAKRKQKKKKTK